MSRRSALPRNSFASCRRGGGVGGRFQIQPLLQRHTHPRLKRDFEGSHFECCPSKLSQTHRSPSWTYPWRAFLSSKREFPFRSGDASQILPLWYSIGQPGGLLPIGHTRETSIGVRLSETLILRHKCSVGAEIKKIEAQGSYYQRLLPQVYFHFFIPVRFL